MRIPRKRNSQVDIEAVSQLDPENQARLIGRGLLMAPVAISWSAAAGGCLIVAAVRTWNRRAQGLPAALRDGVPWPAAAVLAAVRLGLVPVYRHNKRVIEEMLRSETSPVPAPGADHT